MDVPAAIDRLKNEGIRWNVQYRCLAIGPKALSLQVRSDRQEVVFPAGLIEFTLPRPLGGCSLESVHAPCTELSLTLSRAVAGRNRLQFAAAISM